MRIAGSGQEVWRELAYWEGWPRAVAVRELLETRYADWYAGLVGTYQGVTWLAGDSNQLTLERASEADAPWVGE